MSAVPGENVATIASCASVIEGVSRSRNALLNGDTRNYDWDSGYTCHQLGSGAIVIQLAQPYSISSLRYIRPHHSLCMWCENQKYQHRSVSWLLSEESFWTTFWNSINILCLQWVLRLLSWIKANSVYPSFTPSACSGCCCGTVTSAHTVITLKSPPTSSSGRRWSTAPGWRVGETPVTEWHVDNLNDFRLCLKRKYGIFLHT